jgi:hypothetical protein
MSGPISGRPSGLATIDRWWIMVYVKASWNMIPRV